MKEEYKEILNSDWLLDIIDKHTTTCYKCGEIKKATLIYSGDKKSEYICESCKLKSERDSKIESILK
jgi:hypothetical protein